MINNKIKNKKYFTHDLGGTTISNISELSFIVIA